MNDASVLVIDDEPQMMEDDIAQPAPEAASGRVSFLQRPRRRESHLSGD